MPAAGSHAATFLNWAERAKVAVVSVAVWAKMYHNMSELIAVVTTGDGKQFNITANNGSPGGVRRTVDGAIAICVLEILEHPGIVEYLARPEDALEP